VSLVREQRPSAKLIAQVAKLPRHRLLTSEEAAPLIGYTNYYDATNRLLEAARYGLVSHEPTLTATGSVQRHYWRREKHVRELR
jgi:hypothetical protein